jgi:hypothetical protein
MTPEQQRIAIAIAEACGLTVIKTPFTPSLVKAKGCVFTDEARDEWRKAYPNSAGVYGIPDYTGDLNAMHAELKSQTQAFRSEFDRLLHAMAEEKRLLVTELEAKDWAEAFLRTLNLWKPTPCATPPTPPTRTISPGAAGRSATP